MSCALSHFSWGNSLWRARTTAAVWVEMIGAFWGLGELDVYALSCFLSSKLSRDMFLEAWAAARIPLCLVFQDHPSGPQCCGSPPLRWAEPGKSAVVSPPCSVPPLLFSPSPDGFVDSVHYKEEWPSHALRRADTAQGSCGVTILSVANQH